MALIRPDFWIPPLPDFILGLVDHSWRNQFTTFAPVSPLDYLFPILIATAAFAVQCWLLLHLLRKGKGRKAGTNGSKPQPGGGATNFFFVANIALGLLFGLSGLIFFANTASRMWAFRHVWSASSLLPKIHPTVCSTIWCFEVPERIGKLNQALELALSAVMQSLILIADFLLVVRCYIVFSDKFWVWALAAFPFAVSVGSTIAGVVVIISARNSFDGGAVYYSYHFHLGNSLSGSAHISPFVSTASSVIVNLIVTVAIVSRVLHARRRMSKLTNNGPKDPVGAENEPTSTQRASLRSSVTLTILNLRSSPTRYHTTTSALLIESAVPSAVCGILACVIQPDFIRSDRMAIVINARYTLRMLWVTFTVAAPQLILLRVMKRRDAHTLSQAYQQESSSQLPAMQFSDADSASVRGVEDGLAGVEETRIETGPMYQSSLSSRRGYNEMR